MISLSSLLAEPGSRAEITLATAVTGVAVVLLGVEAVLLGWQLWPRDNTAPPPEPAARSTPGDTAARSRDTAPVVDAHLFGRAPEADAPAPTREAPPTQLDLTLHGVVAGPSEDTGLAIIAAAGGDEHLYRPGDTLPGGARLEGIRRDRVILSRDGHRETLTLPEKTSPPRQQERTAAPRTSSQPTGTPSAPQTLADYRDQLLSDPGAVQRLLQPTPVRDSAGALVGFRLRGGGDVLYSATALEPGDVITAVGDVRLDNEGSAVQALQRLGNAGQVTLTVRRNGSERQITLNFGNGG
ncbi:type II secretion system protein N [Arhodomonas aquaeolei]|uniref:type II secretion system protein N n=1 Tax=Arhodomonas aquaeolei TaxID=2369 RepID=UPI00037CE77F|nr:type II secretion system protein N [Arhodomonas aquaeolei]